MEEQKHPTHGQGHGHGHGHPHGSADENQKKLGLFDCFSIGIGGQIGSGIFLLLGVALILTGRSACYAELFGYLSRYASGPLFRPGSLLYHCVYNLQHSFGTAVPRDSEV